VCEGADINCGQAFAVLFAGDDDDETFFLPRPQTFSCDSLYFLLRVLKRLSQEKSLLICSNNNMLDSDKDIIFSPLIFFQLLLLLVFAKMPFSFFLLSGVLWGKAS